MINDVHGEQNQKLKNLEFTEISVPILETGKSNSQGLASCKGLPATLSLGERTQEESRDQTHA